MEENKDKEKEHDAKNPLEWVVFGVSLLLLITVLAYLIYKSINHQSSPPDLIVEYKAAPSQHDINRYKISLQNTGGETAEEVKIEFILIKSGEELEKADLQMPFVPRNSKREGYVSFLKDPAQADTIIARVVSFKIP